ncbi:MAG: DUF11 domain-containing protein, partial [Chloroflexi bacterium]|nr:DUF11 domain-containing protein [Chloroflexota bacterium]
PPPTTPSTPPPTTGPTPTPVATPPPTSGPTPTPVATPVPTPGGPPAPTSDLSVTLADAPDPVKAGSALAYFITVTNHGPSTANNATVAASLPDQVTLISATTQGSCTLAICGLGNMPPGSSVAVSMIVHVNPSAAGGLATSACASATTADPNLDNNCATASTTVAPAPVSPTPTPGPTPPGGPGPTPPAAGATPAPGAPTPAPATPADLMLAQVDSPDPVEAGSNLTYGIIVTNLGPGTAQAVVASEDLPAGVTLVSVTPSRGLCISVTCELGDIAPGGSVAISIIVTVEPEAEATITATACVTADTPDPDRSSNCASQDTTVLAPLTTPSPTPPAPSPEPSPSAIVLPGFATPSAGSALPNDAGGLTYKSPLTWLVIAVIGGLILGGLVGAIARRRRQTW